eukprot:10175404-Alexandrium_andersonii.AAC.1
MNGATTSGSSPTASHSDLRTNASEGAASGRAAAPLAVHSIAKVATSPATLTSGCAMPLRKRLAR